MKIGEGFIISIVIIGVMCILATCQESRRWNKFKIDNNCKVVEEMDSSLGTGFGGINGSDIIIVSIPGKECWLCDDGKKYWKDK